MSFPYLQEHFASIVGLHEAIEEEFYTEILRYFRVVLYREYPHLGEDEALPSDILLRYVCRVQSRTSFWQIERKLRGNGRPFADFQSYMNYLYVMFKNAIREHLRDLGRQDQTCFYEEGWDRDERYAHLDDVFEPPEDTTPLVERVMGRLSDEERGLLRERYVQGATLEGIAANRGMSKSTVDRRLKRVERTTLRRLVGPCQRRDYTERQNLNLMAGLVHALEHQPMEAMVG